MAFFIAPNLKFIFTRNLSQLISNKEINRLAIPAIISGIAEPVISIVDTAFIGQLGIEELGAVGIASSFFLLIIWVLAQTKTAVSAIVARHFGGGTLFQIKTFVPQAVVIVFGIGAFVYFITDIFSTLIFTAYNAQGSLLDLCNDYYGIRSMGIPVVLSTFALFGVFRGVQNTSWAMIISMIGAGVNIVLDYFLIFGIENAIEPMGVKGAALASLLAQICMLILAIWFLYRKTIFKLFSLPKGWHPELKFLGSLSTHLFIRTISLNVAYALAVRFATGYGAVEIAAHTIAMNIWLFSSFFIDGYANAGNALSGRLLGSGKKNLIYLLGNKLIKISVGIATLLAGSYLITYPFIASFFSKDQSVISMFNSFFWLIVISQPINGVAFALDGIFKGMGRGKLLMFNLLISTFIVFVPLLYLLDYYDLNLHGVWIAFIFFMISRGAILWWKLIREFK